MTEAEWLAGQDPETMLEVLRDTASDRKLRLFGLICCSCVDHRITDRRGREAIEFAREHIDSGVLSQDGAPQVYEAVCDALSESEAKDVPLSEPASIEKTTAESALSAVESLLAFDPRVAARFAAKFSAKALYWDSKNNPSCETDETYPDSIMAHATAQHASYLREVFGNPFRPVTFDPAWRTSTVAALAAGMYESRDFSPMPILADALEDAGCDNVDILDHCRGPGPHVRGCWVVDLVLGKS